MTEVNPNAPTVGVMIDLETLGLGPNAVISQVGMRAYSLDDPEKRIGELWEFLPIEPQLKVRGREVDGETIIWWLTSPDVTEDARKQFVNNMGRDLVDLDSLVRSIVRKFKQWTDGANYEVWARGPQFDIVKLESLFAQTGEEIPWRYDSIRDLRSVMKIAGVKSEDVDSSNIVPHRALDDCRFQIRCYVDAMRNLRAK